MGLTTISKGQLPPEVASKLMEDEVVYHFSYIDSQGGGCSSPSTAKQWILVTAQRIVFEASVREGVNQQIKYEHQSGSIPMSKVSFVGTSTSQSADGCGCSMKIITNLRINSSGGEIVLAIPTHEEASRLQGVIDAILSGKS
jgi:hypothetical protein